MSPFRRIPQFLFFTLAVLLYSLQALAQRDSLVLKNHDVIVGELKSMDRGIVTIETDYSDKDFKIEWNGISEIYSESKFLITLTDGERFTGPIYTSEGSMIFINDAYGNYREVEMMEIVYLNSVDDGFKSRLYASIDLGFSYIKANNLRSLNITGNLGYIAEFWSININYNDVQSTQDNVVPIRRSDGNVSFRYYMPNDWFLLGETSFLSNTEQQLDLRSNLKLGPGKFFIHTNRAYWAFQGGASLVNENYSNETPDKQSFEGFVGTELNLFDIGDLSLLTNLVVFPGISERGRWRLDFKFDLKYDLPYDFYIKLGYTANFDNQPAENASDLDYVFQTSFGWEW